MMICLPLLYNFPPLPCRRPTQPPCEGVEMDDVDCKEQNPARPRSVAVVRFMMVLFARSFSRSLDFNIGQVT